MTNAKRETIYRVTTGRGSADERQTLAVCTTEDEANATASAWQRGGAKDVNVRPVPIDD